MRGHGWPPRLQVMCGGAEPNMSGGPGRAEANHHLSIVRVVEFELALFDEVGEVVRGLAPPDFGELHYRAHRSGIKVWFDAAKPPREHYEAQLIRAGELEIGFHAEHPTVADNDKVVARLAAREKQWRKLLGDDAVLGPFLGRADTWRRLSEVWPDPDLDDPTLAMEVGARLIDYLNAVEPARAG